MRELLQCGWRTALVLAAVPARFPLSFQRALVRGELLEGTGRERSVSIEATGTRHPESSCAAAGIECEGGLHSNVRRELVTTAGLKSTTQTATGINAARVVQKSMGMTGGSFKTREFFHGASARAVRMAGGLPGAGLRLPPLLAPGVAVGSALARLLALASQAAGPLAERWFFFAQARHPQNILLPGRVVTPALPFVRWLKRARKSPRASHLAPGTRRRKGKPTLKDPQEIEDFLLYRLFVSRTSACVGRTTCARNSESPPRMEDPGVPRPHAGCEPEGHPGGGRGHRRGRGEAGPSPTCILRAGGQRRPRATNAWCCLRLTDDGVQIHGKAKLMAAAYNR